MIRDTLLSQGIAESRVTMIPDEQEAIEAALSMARPGDLVLLFADALVRSWKQVVYFRSSPDSTAEEAMRSTGEFLASQVALSTPDAERADGADGTGQDGANSPATLGDDVVLVRDERGVHIAREQDD
jgi:cyanophycin synthetase